MTTNEQTVPLKEQPDDATIYASMQQKKIPEFESQRGRQHLLCNQLQKATKSFSKAIMAFQFLLKDNKLAVEQIQPMLKHTIIPCYSNLTLCYYKLNQFENVVQFATSVLQNQRDNVKALYRRGVGYKNLKKFREAREDLIKVRNLDPEMQGDVDRLLKEVKKGEEMARERRKKIAEGMLAGLRDQREEEEGETGENPGVFKRMYLKVIGICKKLTSIIRKN